MKSADRSSLIRARWRSTLALGLVLPLLSGCDGLISKSGLTFTTGANDPSGASNNHLINPAALSGPFSPAINVMPVSVDGVQCDAQNSYFNEPCTSVTICQPGTNHCQTINDILVDTGSYGLRIFSSVITVPLSPVTGSSGSIAECATFGIGADWGQVEYADVVLGDPGFGGELAPNAPVQVINSGFANLAANPSWCGNGQVDKAPADAGFKGILGVGVAAQDCGAGCVGTADNKMYFACSGNSCQGTTIALNQQVTNPVALITSAADNGGLDNNGVLLWFPAVAPGGAPSIEGQMVLGIGTRSNNTPAGATTLAADSTSYEVLTNFNGQPENAILDSGSNALYFDDGSLPTCGSSPPYFYCPQQETLRSGTLMSINGANSIVGKFLIGDDLSLIGQNLLVFSDLGAQINGAFFIWGLPFFYGRTIFVGIEGTYSTLGHGPYWAY